MTIHANVVMHYKDYFMFRKPMCQGDVPPVNEGDLDFKCDQH